MLNHHLIYLLDKISVSWYILIEAMTWDSISSHANAQIVPKEWWVFKFVPCLFISYEEIFYKQWSDALLKYALIGLSIRVQFLNFLNKIPKHYAEKIIFDITYKINALSIEKQLKIKALSSEPLTWYLAHKKVVSYHLVPGLVISNLKYFQWTKTCIISLRVFHYFLRTH